MKKKKFLFLLPLVFLALNFYSPFSKNENTVTPPAPSEFPIGCIGSALLMGANYQDLGINFTHAYVLTGDGQIPGQPDRHTPYANWVTYPNNTDRLYDDVPENDIQTKLGQISTTYNSKVAWMRPKIEWLVYGQSSIYEAEPLDELNNPCWFYSYNDHETGNDTTDNTQYGNGDTVMYCEAGTHSSGFVVKRLKTNAEQCRRITGPDEINHWQGDSECMWYVKPRIRIPASVAANSPNMDVCKVYVIDQDSNNKITPVIIKAGHFRRNTSNPYQGDYLEEFFFIENNDPSAIPFNGDLGDKWEYRARGTCPDDSEATNRADIKIEWLGNCDMWLDHVKVENDIASDLFKGNHDDWIEDEANAISGYEDKVQSYFMELFEFNNIPCMAYVNEGIKYHTNNQVSLMADQFTFFQYHLNHSDAGKIVTPEMIKKLYVDAVDAEHVFTGNPYSLVAAFPDGCDPNQINHDQHGRIPNTLPDLTDDYLLGEPVAPAIYDAWLQNQFDSACPLYDGGVYNDPCCPIDLIGVFSFLMKHGHEVSKEADIPFVAMLQGHQWSTSMEVDREPTQEEQDLMTNLAISYGARAITYWGYVGKDEGICDHNLGLVKPVALNFVKRMDNIYGQPKWNSFKSMFARVKKWGTNLLSFDNANRNSYIYRLEEERNALHINSYFQDIITYKPGESEPPCMDAFPGDAPVDYEYECAEDRYLQVATFKNPAEPSYAKYFMIVNRRCSPFIDESSDDNNGGQRKIKVKFKASALPEAVNWKLVDLDTEEEIFFSKNGGLVDLESFLPGEGKLYKMTPVVIDGGSLIDDEVINANFTLTDTVFTDGFNLTIEDGSTITFDTNGVIIAQGGNFTCGDISGTQGVDLIGTGEWKGIKLISCDTVKIYNTSIEDIKDSSYAVDMFNCKNVEMEGNTFTLDNSGAVRGSYILSFEFFTPNIVLYDNTVNIGGNTLPVFNFNANSASSFPVIIDDCVMNSPSSSSSSAISITNISGGVIKNNDITGYNTSVLALSSAMDFYNNAINSSLTGSSISAFSGSTLNLAPGMSRLNAGFNYIGNSDDDAHNIEVNNSLFVVHEGHNTFDISGSYDNGKHFSGYFPGSSDGAYSIDYNCYTYGEEKTDPEADVTWGYLGDPVVFSWGNDCESGESAGHSSKTENTYLVIPISDVYNDTIEIKTGELTGSPSDSLRLKMRERDYDKVLDIAKRILINFPDSSESYDAVNKLYLASLRLDSAGSKMTPLKAFLEEVILDNGDKPGLVSRAFYFIQKCKAALGDYQSAMAGFEDIMNNNPNTYEALVASWDYAATALLLNGGNSGGSRNAVSINNDQLSIDNNESVEKLYELKSNSDDPDDRSKLTKEQKQQVKVNVVRSFEETRKEEINVVNKLKEKSDRGDRNAQKELKRRETLQAVVTKRQPADIYEHINNVSSNIRIVFNSTEDNSIKKDQNSVPVEFELSQNFPNPFNPTTKIQYALPKDGKVQLVIYDILGREMAKLVNNEFKSAGRYVSEFNGSRLASGIYFYRIIVNDGKDFNSVKKMVLIK